MHLLHIGKYEEGLTQWKAISYDGTLKEQTRTTISCLIETKIAINNKEAADWLARIADKEIADAQAQLGMLYYAGTGVQQNTQTAIYWWKKAAQNNLTEAETTLGTFYLLGPDEFRDIKEGKVLLNRAVQKGDANATDVLKEFEEKHN